MRNETNEQKIARLESELKVEKAKKKTSDSNKKYFYVISQNNNEVQMKSSDVLPSGTNLAYWEGPSGSKTLKTQGSFKDVLKKLTFVSGYMCTKIKPLLKEMGFKYSPKSKTWDNSLIVAQPQALVESDLPY